MPRQHNVIMAKSIYDKNESLPEALVINKQPDLKQSLINPDMDRSNNRQPHTNAHINAHNDDCCDDCCDGCCDNDNDTLLLICCICCVCDN